MTDRRLVTRQALSMGTTLNIEVVTAQSESLTMRYMERVLTLFHLVETVCSRFADDSEVRRISKQSGIPVQVSDTLFELVRFALEIASLTNGNFDPTIGNRMASLGFKFHYLTGLPVTDWTQEDVSTSYKDVILDEQKRTILLKKP